MQQQQGKDELGTRTSLNALYLLSVAWAWCLLPFLRVNMGTNAIGIRGLMAIGVMWVYAALAKCPELVPFFWVWLVFVILQRLRTAQLTWRGVVQHSKYLGDPLVMKFMPFIRTVSTAKLLEVIMCFAAGLVLSAYWPLLGGFVLIGTVGMAIMFSIDDQIMRNRQQAMRDAEIEQRFMADLHRGRRDDY